VHGWPETSLLDSDALRDYLDAAARKREAQRARLKSLRGVAGAIYGRTEPTAPLRFWAAASGFSCTTSAFCSVPSSTFADAWFFVMSSATTISCWRLVAAESFSSCSKGWLRCFAKSSLWRW
jgi:hypothetical protein